VDAGFDVTGIDVSPQLLQIAQTACPRAKFQVGSIWPRMQALPQGPTALGKAFISIDNFSFEQNP
jgi:hypothetical protein